MSLAFGILVWKLQHNLQYIAPEAKKHYALKKVDWSQSDCIVKLMYAFSYCKCDYGKTE